MSGNAALDRLKAREWSMGCGGSRGKGQCPACNGVSETWLGHPLHLTAASIGHFPGCPLAAALLAAGAVPLMQGEFQGPEYEPCLVGEHGFLSTRLKTADGCPRYRAANERWQREWDEALFGVMSGRVTPE